MRKLMAIFAHPDDEGAIAGTLAYYARQDTEIILVCATKGEVGEISDPALATPETLGEVRQKELEAACEIIGIQQLDFLGFRDSGMDGTPENNDPRALVQADSALITEQLVGLIRQFKSDVVITFEPFGWYGHPDHQVVSRWATSAFAAAGDIKAYPNSGTIWQPELLFHAVIPFSKFQAMIQAAIEAGYLTDDGFGGNIPQEQQLKTEANVTHVIDVIDFFDIKQNAMMAHRTQFAADSMFRKIPKEMMIKVSGSEYFIQVYPSPPQTESNDWMTDLFSPTK